MALRAGWAAGGLVVAAGVDGQLAEQFAGGGVDDADVEVVDEHEHVADSAWVRPTPRWCSRPAMPRVTTPLLSMRSWRTRVWVSWSRLVAGRALGRAP